MNAATTVAIREDVLRDLRYPVHKIADRLLPYLVRTHDLNRLVAEATGKDQRFASSGLLQSRFREPICHISYDISHMKYGILRFVTVIGSSLLS